MTITKDDLRGVACLAHSVPGVSLVLSCGNGDRVLVSATCLGANLDPCQLRAALLAPQRPGRPQLADTVTDVDIVGGLVHIGGGVYEPTAHEVGAERWFVTPISHRRVATIASDCPIDLPDGSIGVRLGPDDQLGWCAVCVECHVDAWRHRLDEVATWLQGACLVEELTSSIRTPTGERRRERSTRSEQQ